MDNLDVLCYWWLFGNRCWNITNIRSRFRLCSSIFILITDIKDKAAFVTVFALISKSCVTTGWMSLMLLTAELYPTVVRNIGSGIHNATGGIGTMVAPMVIFASEKIPGLLYMVFAVLMFLSAFFVIFLPETNNQALEDTIDVDSNNSVSKKIKSVFIKPERKGYGSLN
ncbi:organic anion transporter 3-like isoform X2 [Mytilus edulis]|uniref:organic anion transporter 3-like isoform X2 n=1 Tax=Mytilus edulis TaxID=6550 RepID=UPI0039EF1B20